MGFVKQSLPTLQDIFIKHFIHLTSIDLLLYEQVYYFDLDLYLYHNLLNCLILLN